MGGTGKSQVLKALIKFFQLRKEEHRIIIVAPTGSAAALLGGSTYHSVFGINERQSTNVDLAQVRSRLEGVDYVFFDEVSMLSTKDMYQISVQLCNTSRLQDMPFGGMNMIFAGDFAQLPPIMGEDWSLYGRRATYMANNPQGQKKAIGRSLWHQVTTVIILRQNMRQRSQSADDAKLRTALENMRYKDCTDDDITFLKSRVSNARINGSTVKDPLFRDVSIITAWNIHKDEINRLGSERFAIETGQELIDFYSNDLLKHTTKNDNGDDTTKFRSKNKLVGLQRITDELQSVLWNQPPSSTSQHLPGKLRLCIGLPVMIRYNNATELCITKGQEATVYAWQSTVGNKGQRALDTLFVKLVNPPADVQMDGLPLNVVPLTPSTVGIEVDLPSRQSVNITREQVQVLPNFAMTDYASQGKTRPYNVVDVAKCRSHQALYTCLSRSATAEGTLILQRWTQDITDKVQGRASSALRQEFRELELLDEITKLCYHSKLDPKVIGLTWIDQIRAYQKVMGAQYVLSYVHSSIQWSVHNPFIENELPNIKWHIITKESVTLKDTKFIPAQGSVKLCTYDNNTRVPTVSMPSHKESKEDMSTKSNMAQLQHRDSAANVMKFKLHMQKTALHRKRHLSQLEVKNVHKKLCSEDKDAWNSALCWKRCLSQSKVESVCKKIRGENNDTGWHSSQCLEGLIWSNNSCAYNTLLSILYNMWNQDIAFWTAGFKRFNGEWLKPLSNLFSRHQGGEISLEEARDKLH